VAILSAVSDAPPEMLAGVLVEYGLVLTMLDRGAEAEPVLRRALALSDGGAADGSPMLAVAVMSLGMGMMGRGRPAEAEAMLRRAVALTERHFGPSHFETRKALLALGMTLRELGRLAEAEQVLRRAVYAHAQTGIWDNVEAITTAMAVGDVVERRDPAAARIFYARAALGVRRRLETYRDYGAAAQAELAMFAPVFHSQVRTAWAAQR
jgi:tetratricopeptide (TPR) repeat protein